MKVTMKMEMNIIENKEEDEDENDGVKQDEK
jgi:hypothetical protein